MKGFQVVNRAHCNVNGTASFHCVQWCVHFSSSVSLVLIHAFTSVWKGNKPKVSKADFIEQPDWFIFCMGLIFMSTCKSSWVLFYISLLRVFHILAHHKLQTDCPSNPVTGSFVTRASWDIHLLCRTISNCVDLLINIYEAVVESWKRTMSLRAICHLVCKKALTHFRWGHPENPLLMCCKSWISPSVYQSCWQSERELDFHDSSWFILSPFCSS